jgi:sporulation protein YlmC with PRC-barrel domain
LRSIDVRRSRALCVDRLAGSSPAGFAVHRCGKVIVVRLDLGCPVHCADGAFGELADVVIDPTTRRVTHLVVQPQGAGERTRLVPVERARVGDEADGTIVLDASAEEIGRLEPVRQAAYLRMGEFPVEDPDWQVGVGELLALPYYQGLDAVGAAPIAYEDHVMWKYDRIPKGDVEIRRASPVTSSDRHHVGHVDGFVVDAEDHIGHLVLEHGHLWGQREVVIPIGAVASVETDAVVLTLTKDEVGALESRRVHRWH